jgi:hypothetical protein
MRILGIVAQCAVLSIAAVSLSACDITSGNSFLPFQALTTGLGWLCFFAIVGCLLIFPLLAIFRSTRRTAGYGYVAASFVFGLSLWIMCFLTVFDSWGLGAALVGALMIGVGVFPMALAALAWASQWYLFAEVITIGAIVYATRTIGLWLASKA